MAPKASVQDAGAGPSSGKRKGKAPVQHDEELAAFEAAERIMELQEQNELLQDQLTELTKRLDSLTAASASVTVNAPPTRTETTQLSLPGIKLPTFQGKPEESVANWAKTVRSLIPLLPEGEINRRVALVNGLKGTALSYALEYLQQNPALAAIDIVEKLVREFDHADPVESARAELETYAMGPKEDVHSYIQRGELIFDRIPGMTEEEKKQHIRGGLQRWLKDALNDTLVTARMVDPDHVLTTEKLKITLKRLEVLKPRKSKGVELQTMQAENSNKKPQQKKRDGGQVNKNPGSKLPHDEYIRRRSLGLCFKCNQPFSKGHICSEVAEMSKKTDEPKNGKGVQPRPQERLDPSN